MTIPRPTVRSISFSEVPLLLFRHASIALCLIAVASGAANWSFHFDSAAPACNANCQHDKYETSKYLKSLDSSNAGIVIIGNGATTSILRNLESDTSFWITRIAKGTSSDLLPSNPFDTATDHFLLPDMRSRLSDSDGQVVVSRGSRASPPYQIFAFPVYSDGLDSVRSAFIRWVGGMAASGCDSIVAKGRFKSIGHIFSLPTSGVTNSSGTTPSPMVSAMDSSFDRAVNSQWLNAAPGNRWYTRYLVFALVASLPTGSTCSSSTTLSITTDFIELVMEGSSKSSTSTRSRQASTPRERRIHITLRDAGAGDGFDPSGRTSGHGAGIKLGGR